MIRGLVFDFDGLILETEGPIFQSWQEIFQSYGCPLMIEDWEVLVGTADERFNPLDRLEKCVGRSLDRELIARERLQREIDLIALQPVLPGVREYLNEARNMGLKVGLASCSTCSWVTGHLSRLGLAGYFDCIKASDDVHHTKPDPALYISTLTGLSLLPSQAIAFEDSPNGILAAKRAGLFCVAVPNPITRQLKLDHADLRLVSLVEMPLQDLLEKIEPLLTRQAELQ